MQLGPPHLPRSRWLGRPRLCLQQVKRHAKQAGRQHAKQQSINSMCIRFPARAAYHGRCIKGGQRHCSSSHPCRGRGLDAAQDRRPVVDGSVHACRQGAGGAATIGSMWSSALAQVVTAKTATHGGAAVRQACQASSHPRRFKRGVRGAEWASRRTGRDGLCMVDPGLEVVFVSIARCPGLNWRELAVSCGLLGIYLCPSSSAAPLLLMRPPC